MVRSSTQNFVVQNSDDPLHALRPRVASWWLPDAIVRVDVMPLAMTGTIDKKRLRADHGAGDFA